jgi:(2Fe-2S) ferredoxin
MYSGVTREDVGAIIEEHLLGGKPVERLLTPAEFWS